MGRRRRILEGSGFRSCRLRRRGPSRRPRRDARAFARIGDGAGSLSISSGEAQRTGPGRRSEGTDRGREVGVGVAVGVRSGSGSGPSAPGLRCRRDAARGRTVGAISPCDPPPANRRDAERRRCAEQRERGAARAGRGRRPDVRLAQREVSPARAARARARAAGRVGRLRTVEARGLDRVPDSARRHERAPRRTISVTNATMDGCRSSGSFASARGTSASTSGGTVAAAPVGPAAATGGEERRDVRRRLERQRPREHLEASTPSPYTSAR